MKRERKYEDGEYQVWSGVARPNKRGLYIVYWRGMEIGRERHLWEATSLIGKHKYMMSGAPAPAQPITPETEAWLNKMFDE